MICAVRQLTSVYESDNPTGVQRPPRQLSADLLILVLPRPGGCNEAINVALDRYRNTKHEKELEGA